MGIPNKRIWLYAAILLILTGTILVTQVSWIVQSARIEESFLNQRVNMALCSAMDVLSKDKGMCSSLESCVSHSTSSFELTLIEQKKQMIDSVIREHLLFYNIQVPFQTSLSPYSFDGVKKSLPTNQALLFPPAKAGMQNVLVDLEIPSKNELISAQINGTFVLSIVMLGLLTLVFTSTLRALAKERAVRNETVDFVNSMAHDLKTPISNISVALTMFSRENPNVNGSGNQYLSIIKDETSKLKHRAKKILGIASVDAMLKSGSRKTDVDIHDLINQSIQSFGLKVKETNGEITATLEAGHHIVHGNEIQLASALSNIIDNAIIYSQNLPLVAIKTMNTDQNILIEISDRGPGIPKKEIELIFKKGYRIHNGHVEGFGMGLYLAKNLVEKQEGKLTLHSDGKNGSKFVIELPLK
jgi:signal transduction histidine kinase